MKNKVLSLGLALVIIIAGFLIAGALSKTKEMPRNSKTTQTHKLFNFKIVKSQKIPVTITVGGHLQAYHKITLFAEVSGILHEGQTSFRAGNLFKKNQAVLHIDDSVYRNNVLAQKSSLLNQLTLFLPDFAIDFPASAKKWQQYLAEFRLDERLKPLPRAANSKEQYFIASRNIYNLYYSVKSMEALLAKYTIRAPFDGVVTEADITPGSLVRAGQKLGEFTSTDLFELEVPVNIADLPFIRKGDRVTLSSDDVDGLFSGRIKRINAKIDRASQTVKAYIIINNARLKDGMYLTARITSGHNFQGFRIPAVWLIGNDQLYVKKDSRLVLTKVHIVRNDNDYVIVNGLSDGTQILAQEISGRAKTIQLD